jgi:hypothetical protein
LLSSISNSLEKIVAKKLVFHLSSNDLLYQHQYGFIAKKSTEHNLMHIDNYVSTALNDEMYHEKNYLSGRSQKVEINGTLSDPLDLEISVIQGSYLAQSYSCVT